MLNFEGDLANDGKPSRRGLYALLKQRHTAAKETLRQNYRSHSSCVL